MAPPHPIPYQGSKRCLSGAILATVGGRRPRRLFEPFAGSAAITLAAAEARLAERFVVGDSLAPLMGIWREILAAPDRLADAYERLWSAGDYGAVRAGYNRDCDPAALLYLLARCAKSAPRWSRAGAFNQSPDRRRTGRRPERMRSELVAASALLGGRTELRAGDFEATIADAGPDDLVYLDPPWQGTTDGRDKRYHQGLARARLLAALAELQRRAVPFLLSYDGRRGVRSYGEPLPPSLGLLRMELSGGRSSQATLHGRAEVTIESLYVWSPLSAGSGERGG